MRIQSQSTAARGVYGRVESLREGSARRPASTGSPCDTSTRSTGRSRSGRSESASFSGGRLLGEPGGRAEAKAAVPVPEEHVAGHERAVLRDPEHDLGSPGRGERLDSARERVVGPERVRHDAGAPLDRAATAGRRPDAGAVALDHRRRAARVPEDRDEHVHRASGPLDVLVERGPEALGVVRRDERVDEDDAVARLAVDAADVFLPLLVVCRPAPQARPRPRVTSTAAILAEPNRQASRMVGVSETRGGSG